ncbi:MAG: hypothetical protein ACREV5_22455 [Steroidobacter sp.]
MRSKHWLFPALAAFALSSAVMADELKTPPAPETSSARPSRGMSMENVEAAYGVPASRAPAVGEPPITRWEYPAFVVYFEHHLVIHTVARG